MVESVAMELYDVYLGHHSWPDFLSNRAVLEDYEKAIIEARPGAVRVGLSRRDYQTAIESGFGAIGARLAHPEADSNCSIEFSFEKLAGGIDRLNADFNLLFGDIVWKLEMREETLNNILQEIRLAEFEREARAYRNRAEKAYLNCWYEEALGDFLEAERRNYPDFSVHRSIASIYLYHLIDLPLSLEYFTKAAKYARPTDARQSAESHYFAGIVCAVQQRLKEGIYHAREAVALNPELYEAHYQQACMSALLGDGRGALACLQTAIEGDPRYYERARIDQIFDPIRPEVKALLDQLMKTVHQKLAEVRKDAEILKRYIIARPEKRQRITSIFQSIEEQEAEAGTYRAGLRFMETLAQAQVELKSIYDLFFKQYEIDGRDYVRSVAFSPDGLIVASGFLYEGIKIWEVDSASKVRSLKGHTSSVSSLSFSPNNAWLASASRDRTIRLWDVESGRELRTVRGHEAEVRSVAFSPDGEWIASASADQTIRLWRALTGREVQVFAGHAHTATSVAFSPDGQLLASGSLDRTVRLWEAATGREIQMLEGHLRGIETVAFSPDGRWLASGGDDKVVKIWEVSTGRNTQALAGHCNDITSISFSPDGELLAAGSLGQTVRVWKLASGQVIKTLWYPEISWNIVAFSPKGYWLALGSRELELWLKTILTEEQYAQVKAGEEHALLMKYEPELSALQRAEWEWAAEEEALEALLKAKKQSRRVCRICGTKLTLLERLTRKQYCTLHR
jgi:tetratricopeptide (TPR) repeat protein